MEELVSIIMPLYNAEKYINQTLESVINQTYLNWELLITDDGSKDKSIEKVESYLKKEKRIKLYRQENKGSASARNNSLKNAVGRYIVFLDADDLWDQEFLEKQLKFLKENKASVVYGSYRRINENNDEILKPFIVPKEITYKQLLKTCPMTCLTSMYDSKKIGKVFFNESLKSVRDDYVMWLSILKKGEKAYGNRDVLASYRIFSSSTTANKKKMIKPQFLVYYKIEKLGLIKSLYNLVCWAYYGIKKYKKI